MQRSISFPFVQRTWKKRIAAGLLCLGLLGTSTWGVEPPAGGSLFPEEVPEGLTDVDFESLDGAWAEWAADAAARVEKFYSATTPAEQQTALEGLRIKLGTMKTALQDRKYASIHGPLSRLHARLQRRIRIAEAVLESSRQDVTKKKSDELTAARKELGERLSALRSDLKSVAGGEKWLPYVEADALTQLAQGADDPAPQLELVKRVSGKIGNRGTLPPEQQKFLGRKSFVNLNSSLVRLASASELPAGDDAGKAYRDRLGELVTALEKFETVRSSTSTEAVRSAYQSATALSPDGSPLQDAMRDAYFNYNLRVFTGEGILQRMFSDSRREASWINDRVMEASVSGYSCTDTTVSVDVIPDASNAAFLLQVNGNVSVNSTASTDQASIYSVGHHRFHADKRIWTDGHNFFSSPATVSVSANTQITGASTKADWIPIVRRFAQSKALSVANSRRGQANSIAAGKIRQQIGPRLNSEVSDKFNGASMELETRLYGPLRELGVYPDAMSLSSTDTQIELRARVMNPDELAANAPAPGVVTNASEMLVQAHESLLNNSMDRAEFHGQTLTETQVRDRLQERMKKLLGDKFKFPEKAAPSDEARQEITFIFDQEDPIRFQIEDGEVNLQLRTGMHREGQEDIPPQLIIIPLVFTVQGDEILMERGRVSVKPIPGQRVAEPGMQITRANIMRQNIESAFKTQKFKGNFDVGKERVIRLNVHSLVSEAGWITARLK